MDTYKERHVHALLNPSTPEEATISALFHEVALLADRYAQDRVMLAPVRLIAAGLIRLTNDGDSGRIDPGMLEKQVRDTLARVGVNIDDI